MNKQFWITQMRSDQIKTILLLIPIEVESYIKYIFVGLTLSDLGRKEDALQDYTKAIQIDSLNADAYVNRGRDNFLFYKGSLLDDLGRKEEALKDYDKVIQIDS